MTSHCTSQSARKLRSQKNLSDNKNCTLQSQFAILIATLQLQPFFYGQEEITELFGHGFSNRKWKEKHGLDPSAPKAHIVIPTGAQWGYSFASEVWSQGNRTSWGSLNIVLLLQGVVEVAPATAENRTILVHSDFGLQVTCFLSICLSDFLTLTLVAQSASTFALLLDHHFILIFLAFAHLYQFFYLFLLTISSLRAPGKLIGEPRSPDPCDMWFPMRYRESGHLQGLVSRWTFAAPSYRVGKIAHRRG